MPSDGMRAKPEPEMCEMGSAPKKESPGSVSEAISRLNELLCQIEDKTARIESRLEPVLVPSPPYEVPADGRGETEPRCPIAAVLRDQVSRAERIFIWMRYLEGRVAL